MKAWVLGLMLLCAASAQDQIPLHAPSIQVVDVPEADSGVTVTTLDPGIQGGIPVHAGTTGEVLPVALPAQASPPPVEALDPHPSPAVVPSEPAGPPDPQGPADQTSTESSTAQTDLHTYTITLDGQQIQVVSPWSQQQTEAKLQTHYGPTHATDVPAPTTVRGLFPGTLKGQNGPLQTLPKRFEAAFWLSREKTGRLVLLYTLKNTSRDLTVVAEAQQLTITLSGQGVKGELKRVTSSRVAGWLQPGTLETGRILLPDLKEGQLRVGWKFSVLGEVYQESQLDLLWPIVAREVVVR